MLKKILPKAAKPKDVAKKSPKPKGAKSKGGGKEAAPAPPE